MPRAPWPASGARRQPTVAAEPERRAATPAAERASRATQPSWSRIESEPAAAPEPAAADADRAGGAE